MIYVLFCAGSALVGFCIGVLLADRIAEKKLQEIRLQMGLDINTGEEIGGSEEELFKD